MNENYAKEQSYENRRELSKNLRQRLKDYTVITIASFVYAMGIAQFADPNNLAPGGMTGLAIVLSRLIPFSSGTWFLILNIPVIILGIWAFGFKFIVSTMYSTALTALFTNILLKYGAATHDVLLASLMSALLCGAAIGVIFKAGATTGGTDIIVKFLKVKFPYIRTGIIFFGIDVLVVVISGIVFQDINAALYAFISIIVTAKVMDIVLYGSDEARLIYIISDNADQITRRMLEELDIGVTHISGSGAYSGREKKVILCTVKKTVLPLVQDIVKEEDTGAFMIVSSASEVFGEGYKSYFSERI
jgi:uncharacterized membrane-anchored protein YitT (DUF2179 family)